MVEGETLGHLDRSGKGNSMRFGRVIMLSFALTLVGVACGGGSSNQTTTQPPVTTTTSESPTGGATTGSPSGGTTLTLKDNVFDPADFTITAAAQVTLKNEGASLHNFSVEGQNIDKDVQPGETETEDLALPAGTYTMFCKYHRSVGMEGTLTVSG
jgi:plastocyanin